MDLYKITYQDKALNQSVIDIEAESYAEAIVKAFEQKSADKKLIMVEWVAE